MKRSALVAAVVVAMLIGGSLSSQLGMHSHSLLGFSQFVANHFDFPPFVHEGKLRNVKLLPGLSNTIQEANKSVRKILFQEFLANPESVPVERYNRLTINGKEYQPIQVYYQFPQMEKLEQEIQTLKNKIELQKLPEEKAKLQAELKSKQDIFLANIRMNIGYFSFKLEELVKLKVEELENEIKKVEEKFEGAFQAATDDETIIKVSEDMRKAIEPINQQILDSQTFKTLIESQYQLYLFLGTTPASRTNRDSWKSDLARDEKKLAELSFKLPESQMALLKSWMTIPVYDLTIN